MMKIRRCAILFLEPREQLDFDLAELLTGESGLHSKLSWVALAPHLEAEIVVTQNEAIALGTFSKSLWVAFDSVAQRFTEALLCRLLNAGLLLSDSAEHDVLRTRDEALRNTHWKPLSAVAHYFSRWSGVTSGEAAAQGGLRTMQDLSKKLGAPPPHIYERALPEQRQPLAQSTATVVDDVLRQRVTCRNFDSECCLDADRFGHIMRRVFGAQAIQPMTQDASVLKKTSPSGGGLHPTEAYLLIQGVTGVAPGLYHYHVGEHALEPIRTMGRVELRVLAAQLLAGQEYFADAQALVILSTRFGRCFWKYRNHAKAYRATILDAGHLSQTLYVSAAEFGLGAFITAAINEAEIEKAFGFDNLLESPIAVCGLGVRTAQRNVLELDPLQAVKA